MSEQAKHELSQPHQENRRILIVDDNESIHQDFRKILGAEDDEAGPSDARAAFLGAASPKPKNARGFDVVTAFQGEEGVDCVLRALQHDGPFAMAFIDVRMPPGMDGVQTIKSIWEVDPDLQVVLCTAFSDYSFDQIIQELGSSDQLLILKKPFDPVEVRQLAGALTEKWNAIQRERRRIGELEHTNQRLAEANVRAEAANMAKSEFLANMSHEIRTPMNGILGYLDLLCEPQLPSPERQEYVDVVQESANHLLTILNDILDISKIEAGRLQLDSSELDPMELAQEVVTLLARPAGEKGIALELEAASALPQTVKSDATRIRQILINLVGNAIKFTEQGEVRLQLSLGEADASGERALRMAVKDTGIGIPADHLPTLFDAFSQVDGSSTRQAGGTGLGLAISQRLAQILGGRITVESQQGVGSTFTFELALGQQQTGELTSAADAEAGANAPKPAKQPLPEVHGRVLLVEDVPINQTLIQAILGKAGAEVVVAENGQVGVDRFQEAQESGQPFQLVLMDMAMPVMDGYTATKELRKLGYQGPIIALTAHAMSGDRETCIEAGCTDYTVKPVDRRLLLEMCARLLGEHEPAAPFPGGQGGLRPDEASEQSAPSAEQALQRPLDGEPPASA